MRTLSRKSFAIGLLVALLVTYTGRAVPVYALAELAPELAPVFDTQIYQLQDYIDHGGMTDPQLDIFYMLCGFYALGQAGSENYKITNPYSTQGGVLNWLKDVGVESYNTLIGLVPDTVILPNGSIQSTDVLKKAASIYVANLMGCALKAVQYDTVEEFEDDIENSDNFYIPWSKSTQYGLNTMFQTYGGIYNWQFDSQPFTSNASWREANIPVTSTYWTALNNMPTPHVRRNNSSSYSAYYGGEYFSTYHNLFLNTSTGKFALVSDSGDTPSSYYYYVAELHCYNASGSYQYFENYQVYNNNNSWWKNYPSTDTFIECVRQIYDNVALSNSSFPFQNGGVFLNDFVDHVYIGDSWANRNEIFNLINLNFDDTGTDYYVTPADDNNYLLDIKGILNDILNNINLFGVYIDNLFSLDGVPVHDTDLIRITTDIYDLLNQQNPPLPVNLNDISEYTDNTYLDRLKEHARNFGDIFAAYVAFWHNADHDLVYTIFGASIMVLIGAFIGKWGHS